MTTATLPFWARFIPSFADDTAAQSAPARPRRSEPVFIYDAVTPCQGETLLSLMLKCDLAALEADDSAR